MKKFILVALALSCFLLVQASEETDEKAFKIVNGREVRPMFKYPYQAFFLTGNFMCGGTIIGKRHVLTANHCIRGDRPGRGVYVIVGVHRITIQDAFGGYPKEIFGKNIIRVKKFIKLKNGDRSDIGMLELARDIQFSNRVQPACIPVKGAEDYAGRDGVVTGWGGIVGYSPGTYVAQEASDVLLETTLRVQSPNSKLCKKAEADTPDKLCAYNQGHDTCQGDSGGPMTIKENGKFVVIGVTSSGKGCGATNHAGVYMRVSYFHDWIVDNVRDVCISGESMVARNNMGGRGRTPFNKAGCSCSGFGRCKRNYSDFGGLPSCNVKLPTTCSDIVRSSTHRFKYISAEACRNAFLTKPESLYPRKPEVTTTTAATTTMRSGCSCSNFVNRNNFGRCRKPDSDFSGKVSCYVNLPTTCVDIVRSHSNRDKYLSAEACQISQNN